MSKVLSQEEIDALLTSASEIEQAARARTAAAEGQATGVSPYNFRRPDRMSKDQIRSLHLLHDRFARNVSGALSAYLRSVTYVKIVAVEQFTYSEFLLSLPDPTAFYALSIRPLDAVCALEVNPNVAFTMIDRMLGGQGRGSTPTRALTEIEQNVIDGVVKLICDNLTDTWRQIVEVAFEVAGRETRPQMLQVAAANDIVLVLGFDIRLGDTRGLLHLCVPSSVVEAIGGAFMHTRQRTRRAPSEADRRHLLETLSRVKLKVTANLDARLPARELLALQPGDVVSLGHHVRQPLDVRVQGSPKFAGRLVTHEGVVAVRIDPVSEAAVCEA